MLSNSAHALHAGMMMQCRHADSPVAGCCMQALDAVRTYSRECASQGRWSPEVYGTPCDVLQGAERIGLDGVFHSMSKGSKDWPIEHRWYGSDDVVDHWAHFLVSQ